MTKYRIVCLQDYPLSSWGGLHTKKQIRDKFMGYAILEMENYPDKKWFTFENISGYWDVRFDKASVVDIVKDWFEDD